MGSGGHNLPTGTVTFLFTDIEGSTRLLSALGDQYLPLLERHATILRAAIAAGGGSEVNTEGDAFFAAFPSALGAVATAVSAQRELAADTWPGESTVRVRMGLHTGEARLGGDDYVGIDVHRAARIAAAGHGGQVLLSGTTHALVSDALPAGVRLDDLGDHRLKDLDQPLRLWQLEIDGLPTDFPALRTADATRGNLPTQLTRFVGREQELARLRQLAGDHRLVTLTGPGGTGKTRLAVEAAGALLDDFADGAFFVDLAPIHDPGLVSLAISRTLGAGVDPNGDATRAAVSHLRDRQLLLILDNFEQVTEAAPIVEELLSAAPGLKVIATSREALGIYGEQEYGIPPFDVPRVNGSADDLAGFRAVELFVDRARAVLPDFEVSDANAPAIGGILRHVDGLPLAIELAASQVRLLGPATLLSRLEAHLPLPSTPGRGRPERQRSVRDAIDWSYNLLDGSQRRLFARLAAFPGGCSIQGAEAVGDAGDLDVPVLDVLAALVGKSLIRRVEVPEGEPQFAMLEPILEFAAERLREEFDADATDARLAAYLMNFAEDVEGRLTMSEQAAWLDRCEREMPNLRRSFAWAVSARQAEIGLRTAASLWRFWQQRGPMWEGRRLLDQLLGLEGASPGVRGRALGAAGGLAWWSGDFAATRQHFEDALPLLQASGNRLHEAEALYNLGFAVLWSAVLGGTSDADRAEDLFRQSLALAEELGDRRSMARAHRGLGQLLGIARGNPAGAVPIFERSLVLAEEAGDRWEMNESVIAVGNGLRFSGDRDGAKRAYLHGIDLMATNRPTVTGLLFLLTALESEMGHHERVARLWGAAEAARDAAGAIAPPAAQRLIGDPVSAARAIIGDEAVDQGLAEGRAMDHEAAIAYAHAA